MNQNVFTFWKLCKNKCEYKKDVREFSEYVSVLK